VENTKEYIKDNKNGIIKHEIKEETNENKENKAKDKHIQYERKDNEKKQNKEVSSLSKKKKKSRKSNKERQKARGCFIGQIPLLDKDMKDSAKNKLANVETVLKKHFEVLELPLPIRIRLLTVPQTSEFRGMAFCDFKTKEESDTVIEKMHHTTFGTARNKKRINVESLTLDKETMRKTYEDKIDAIIEKYKMCDNFVYWEQNGDNGGTGYESIGGSGHKNRWETNNDLKIGETKSILENDPGLKKFLYSVSLHCAESTLQEASTLVDKFPKKCKDFNTTLRDEKCKYLMGMLKQRC
jgi:RNA recognition motif-containing protein